MPSWPTKEGRTTVTLELKNQMVQHLDDMAEYLGCSRAAYVRGLVIKDMERQGPGKNRS